MSAGQVGALVTLAGVAAAMFGVRGLLIARRFGQRAAGWPTAVGVVLRSEDEATRHGTDGAEVRVRRAVVRYVDRAETVREGRSMVARSGPPIAPGTQVPLRYNPAEPTSVIIAGLEPMATSMAAYGLFTGVGVILTLGGAAVTAFALLLR